MIKVKDTLYDYREYAECHNEHQASALVRHILDFYGIDAYWRKV